MQKRKSSPAGGHSSRPHGRPAPAKSSYSAKTSPHPFSRTISPSSHPPSGHSPRSSSPHAASARSSNHSPHSSSSPRHFSRSSSPPTGHRPRPTPSFSLSTHSPLKFALKKSRSQHFLTDSSVLEGEAEALDVKDEAVLEIGGGDGRLSEKLLARNPSSLTLVELDTNWAGFLKQKFFSDKRVIVLEADFLTLSNDFPTTRIAGNIPYQITSSILLKLGKMKFSKAVLCVQKEVAERLISPAGSSEYGRLSVYAQLHFDMQILAQVPRSSFTPPPKVDSSILCLMPRAGADALPPHLEAVTAALFSHRLQTVSQALLHSRSVWGWSKEEARAHFQNIKIGPRRVFQLKAGEVAELARLLPAVGPGK